MGDVEPARASFPTDHDRLASAVVLDISTRAALARGLAASISELADSLDLSGRPIDAQAAAALRELDVALMLSLPEKHLAGVLEALSAVAAVIMAVKTLR